MLCKVKDSAKGWMDVNLADNRLRTFDAAMRDRLFYPGWNEQFGNMRADDAAEGFAFQIGQLTYLEAKAIQKWYDPLRYEQLLGPCIDFSAGPWAKSVDYKSVKQLGVGEFVGPDSRYFPMVDLAYMKATIGVATGQIGYQYSQEDLLMSAHMKMSLPDDLQSACVLGYKRHANYVALLGDTAKNFTGLYNNASATAAARASGSVWDAATADTIVNDIIDAIGKYNAGTGSNEEPSMMIVPVSTMARLMIPRSTNSDTTVKDFIEKQFNLKIVQDILLDSTANGGKAPGSGSTKRVVFAAPKNDNMVYHVPMPITFLAPQPEGMWLVVPAMYKLGGFELRRVQTVRYMDTV